ncbi:MAG: HDOD domain-containing protein [Phycisphaerae bacterium]|nr:HDOD domain-containing protein [Phycisphaerae bacterium]
MTQLPTANKDKAKRVEVIISQLDSLPTLPAVAARLLQATSDSQANAKQVVQLIQADQSLTATVLSLARRANTGAGGNVSTIDKAVVLMGFNAIRNAVLSIKVFEAFGPTKQDWQTAFDRAEFWKHSLAVACAARLVAQTLAGRVKVDPEEVFVCGLLHDLGKVALDSCLPKSFDRVVRLANSNHACIADVERQILDIDHTVAGRRLGERWHLPDPIVQCMWLHHHSPDALPLSISHGEHVKIVHLADVIARHQRIGYSGNWPGEDNPTELAERLGINKQRLDRILTELPEQIEQRASIIGLENLTSNELYAQALAEANHELARLNVSLNATNLGLQVRNQYFKALSHLTQAVSPRDSLQQICVAAAESVRQALDLGAVLTFARQVEDGYLDVALVDPDRDQKITEIFSPEGDCLLTGELDDVTVESARGGAWIVPAAPQAQALVDRYASQLGSGPYWLMPIVRDQDWLGGAVFTAPAKSVAARRNDAEELESLSTSIGLVIANTQIRQAADRLSEDLAETGRRIHQMQNQLLRTRSLSVIAEMAAGAAHELNNPLAVITGRAQLLRDQTNDPKLRQALDLINEHAHQCSAIVTELMEFARPQPPRSQSISLAEILHKVRASWLAKSWLTEGQFVLRLSDALPAVWFDPAQLEQVLDEVISNAIEAMNPKDGRLGINCLTEPSDDRVVLTVEDNGRGMDAEVLGKACDPFFSHRPAGRNRGLGLARAFRWVEANTGRLRLESKPGQGTTVVLELPTAKASIEESAESAPSTLTV